MRDTTHPAQSVTITAATIGVCLVFLTLEAMRLGFTSTNIFGWSLAIIFAISIWRARSATLPAAMVGGMIVATLYIGTGCHAVGVRWRTALLPLLALLILTLFATRFRRNRKEQLGLAESKSGRRASQVCANLGVAALAAALCLSTLPRMLLLLALSAALVEATADTVSSEIGQALQGKTIMLTTGRLVLAGMDGGISLMGTLAGCAGGAIVAALCAIGLELSMEQVLVCWLAGIAGIFFDSWLGATLEKKGILGNDAVNFLSTCLSALMAGVAGKIFLP